MTKITNDAHVPKFHGDDGSQWIATIRSEFGDWYTCNAFDYASNPIGSRQCDLQWRAYLAARLAPPAGFVMVPVEPTKEMLEAAGTMDNYDVDAGGRHDDDHIAWWKAMLSAAPGAADGVRGG